MISRKGLRPAYKIGLDSAGKEDAFQRVFPFKKAWIFILILVAMDIAFLIPATQILPEAIGSWGQLDSLFDLTHALFTSAWLLGWMVAPLIMTTVLAVMLFGRETLRAGPGYVDIFLGVFVFGVTVRYEAAKIRNWRFEQPEKKSGKSWRGPHLVFDYGAITVSVGSGIQDDEAEALTAQIQAATGQTFRSGEALPSELEAASETPRAATVPLQEPVISRAPLSPTSPSVLVLITANLIPLGGSLFLGWNLGDVMVLYWAESAIVGFFNLCKMAVINRWLVLLAGPFFVGHFGAFMAVHFLFLYAFFVEPQQAAVASGEKLAQVAQLFTALWPALAALFISHAFSFFKNFLGQHEYRRRTLSQQMGEPYKRIIVMHFAIIFGGAIAMLLGSPTPVLVLMIGLKTYFDMQAHLKQHSA